MKREVFLGKKPYKRKPPIFLFFIFNYLQYRFAYYNLLEETTPKICKFTLCGRLHPELGTNFEICKQLLTIGYNLIEAPTLLEALTSLIFLADLYFISF